MAVHPTEQEMQNFDFSKYRLIPLKAIRLNCLDCMGLQEVEVKNFTLKNCPLFPYRMGRKEKVNVVKLSQLIDKSQHNDN